MWRVMATVLVLAMLTGCSQPANAPNEPEKEDVEKAVTEKPKEATELERTTAPQKTTEPKNKYAQDDAAKAAAADHEMTLEDLNGMPDDNAILLGTCQMVKYQAENGKAAMDRWTDEFVDDVASASSAGDVVSIQEAMIKEGYSCTFQEMNHVSAYGVLPEE